MSDELIGLSCPGCGQPPKFLLGDGDQAFCGNETDCHVIMWNPKMPLRDLPQDAQFINFDGLFD